MPYIPRSMAPSGLTDPSLVPRAAKKTKKKSVPLKAKAQEDKEDEKNPMTNRLSMKTWDVDPDKILRHLTGQESNDDE